MQIMHYDKKQAQDLLVNAHTIAIIPGKRGNLDTYCAAAGLYLALKNTFTTKKIDFVYKGEIPHDAERLINKSEIKTQLNERDLIVAVDYKGTNATKVQYATENNVVTFRIGPISKDFNKEERITAKIEGFNYDLIITVGANQLDDLGNVYTNLKEEIEQASKIAIDNSNANARFATVNAIDTSAKTLAHAVLVKSAEWGLNLSPKAAQALLLVIAKETKE